MSDLIPLVVSQEQVDIKSELPGRSVSVIFDGMRLHVHVHVGEALTIVVCFIDEPFTSQQWLIHLHLLAKSTCGEEIHVYTCST